MTKQEKKEGVVLSLLCPGPVSELARKYVGKRSDSTAGREFVLHTVDLIYP